MWIVNKLRYLLWHGHQVEPVFERHDSDTLSQRGVQAQRLLKVMRSVKMNYLFRGEPKLRARHRLGVTGFNVSSIPATLSQTYLTPAVRFAHPWWSEDDVVKSDTPPDAKSRADSESSPDAAKQGRSPEAPQEVRTPIELLDGRRIFEVRTVRYDHVAQRRYKELWVEWPDGTRANYNTVSKSLLPLLGHKDLIVSDRTEVIVTEGWFPAKALLERGKTALGTVTGALSTPSDSALLPIVSAKTIYLWPDNDDAGVLHMQRIAARLHELGAKDIRVVRWAGGPRKGDAADFSGTNTELDAIIDDAIAWQPGYPILTGGVLPVRLPRVPPRLNLSSGSQTPRPRIDAQNLVSQIRSPEFVTPASRKAAPKKKAPVKKAVKKDKSVVKKAAVAKDEMTQEGR